MKLSIAITLDSGGTITIRGEDLTAEGVNEVFEVLLKAGYTVDGYIDTGNTSSSVPSC